MPTYEYVCDACGGKFERFESITAKPMRKCPECGKPRLHRLIGSGAGVIFKGSGFYQTDYRSEGYKNEAKAEKQQTSGDKSKDTADKTDDGVSKKQKAGSKGQFGGDKKPGSGES